MILLAKLIRFNLPEASNAASFHVNILEMLHRWSLFEVGLDVQSLLVIFCHVYQLCPLLSVEESPVLPVHNIKCVELDGR